MSLEEFGKGHGGAGGTPVNGENSTEQSSSAASDTSSGWVKSPELEAVEKESAAKPASSGIIDLKPGLRLPEQFEKKSQMWAHINKGGLVVGVNSDIHGNRTLAAAPTDQPRQKLSKEELMKPLSGVSDAGSEYEDKLRKNMPFPGAFAATKKLRPIINDTQSNFKILTDHWNDLKTTVENDPLHPAREAHQQIGMHLAVTEAALQRAHAALDNGKPHEATVHVRMATNSLHMANQSMSNPEYWASMGGKRSPVPLSSTDIDRAHALVEHPVPNEISALSKGLKLGRTNIDNNRFVFERLSEINSALNHPDPAKRAKYMGLNPQLVKYKLKQSTQGTEKGGPEWDALNAGPYTHVEGFDVDANEGTSRVGETKPVRKGIAPGTRAVTNPKTIPMVYVHPNALPAGTKIMRGKKGTAVEGQLAAFDPLGKQLKMPKLEDVKIVPYGQHYGMKVINDQGMHVPHLNEKGVPLTFEQLRGAGARTIGYEDVTPAPSHPNAPKPEDAAPEKPRNWDTMRSVEREALTTRGQKAVEDREALIKETQAQIEADKDKAFEIMSTGRAKKEEAKRNKPVTSRSPKKARLAKIEKQYMDKLGITATEPTVEPKKKAKGNS